MSFLGARIYNRGTEALNKKKAARLNVPSAIGSVYGKVESHGWMETIGKDNSRMYNITLTVLALKATIAAAKVNNAEENDENKKILFSDVDEGDDVFVGIPYYKKIPEKTVEAGKEVIRYKYERNDGELEPHLRELQTYTFTLRDRCDKPIQPGMAVCAKDVYAEEWEGVAQPQCGSFEIISYPPDVIKQIDVPKKLWEEIGVAIPSGTDDVCQEIQESFNLAYHHITKKSFGPEDVDIGDSRMFLVPAGNVQRTDNLTTHTIHDYKVVDNSKYPYVSKMLITDTSAEFPIKSEETATSQPDPKAPKEISNVLKGILAFEYPTDTDDCEYVFTFEASELCVWSKPQKKGSNKKGKRGYAYTGNAFTFFTTDRVLFPGLVNANQLSYVATFPKRRDDNGQCDWDPVPSKNETTQMPIISIQNKTIAKPYITANFWGHVEKYGVRIPAEQHHFLRQLCRDLWILSPSNRDVSPSLYRSFSYADPARATDSSQDWNFPINDAQKLWRGDLRKSNPLNLFPSSPYKNLLESTADPEPFILKKTHDGEFANEIGCLLAYIGDNIKGVAEQKDVSLSKSTGFTIRELEHRNSKMVNEFELMKPEEINETFFTNMWLCARLYLGAVRKSNKFDSDKERKTKCFAGINAWMKTFASIYLPSDTKLDYGFNEKDEMWTDDNAVYGWTFVPFLFPNFRLQRKRLETSMNSKKREREEHGPPSSLPEPSEHPMEIPEVAPMVDHPEPALDSIPKKVGKKSSKK